ncbi:hypothetical protein Golob_002141 [Gossypium lobatum]|uniref:Uncharacterized protein n=1 Tax=Gossypium lobatum TaxID=34289 RepID=A0A7J8N4C9_9ROSI|nr:hypothetical protein [Gossypium lobatum]
MWTKQELRRLGITDLTVAMAEGKNFYDIEGESLTIVMLPSPSQDPKEMVGEIKIK